MTLIVEDGTNVANAEAYATVSYCDTYWSTRPTSSLSAVWAVSTTANKESAIRIATQYLDNKYRWLGTRQYENQNLQWPRTGVYSDRDVEQIALVPQNVKKAVAELAVRTLSNDLWPDLDKSNYVKREQIGPISVEYLLSAPTQSLFPVVNNMLRDLALSNSTVTLIRG
jgi:hypothetical protein